jgi:hypothetical protein
MGEVDVEGITVVNASQINSGDCQLHSPLERARLAALFARRSTRLDIRVMTGALAICMLPGVACGKLQANKFRRFEDSGAAK